MSKEKVIDISTRKTGKIVGICAAAVAAIIVVVSSVSIVPAGCTGVVTTFGKVSDTALNEGLHLKVPFAQRVTTVSNKIQVYQADADAVSKDLQTVNSTIAVNFRIKSASSASIFKNIGSDYENVILMPTVQECMKSVCAKYTAEQLITDRAQVGEEIKAQLVSKVDEYGIEIEKFNIVNFDFSSEFNEAIEAKQVAEQKAPVEKDQADHSDGGQPQQGGQGDLEPIFKKLSLALLRRSAAEQGLGQPCGQFFQHVRPPLRPGIV